MSELDVLMAYTKQGWPIHPLKGKIPATEHGFKDATTDADQIKKWIKQFPKCGWGVDLGKAGLAVIDIDPRHGGFETFDAIRIDAGLPLIETATVHTGGGGQHLYFTTNGREISCMKLGPGVDLKSNGGYVVLPPSIHPNGKPYEWELMPKEVGVSPLPDWLLDAIKSSNGPGELASTVGAVIASGDRNKTLASLGGSMRRRGMGESEIFAALKVVNEERCKPPIDEKEVLAIAASVSKYKPEIPKTPPVKDVADTVYSPSFHNTDLGNAERLHAQFGHNVFFNFSRNTYLIWDGRYWKPDITAGIERLAHQVIQEMYRKAGLLEDADARKALAKWAINSESSGRLNAMVERSRALLPIEESELNQDSYLLNVNNGTVDLRTGKLREHRQSDRITQIISTDYEPSAKCPKWLSALELYAGGDKEMVTYLQSVIGYSLTGSTSEDALFFVIGTGSNGKTTFVETIRRLLGDYAQRTSIDALLMNWKSQGNAASPYIAGLAGARFVLGSEIPENRKLNESLVKDLTGGDSMAARFLHANPFTFIPTHKLWLFGNYKPKIVGTDLGIWRRIRLIPFLTTIEKSDQAPREEIIGDFEREFKGILSWAIEGAVRWKADGLADPKSVIDATKEYKSEQDILQQFIDEKCKMSPGFEVMQDDFFRAMRRWAEENNEGELERRSKKWLTYQLKMRGIGKDASKRKYKGIQLTIPYVR